MEPEVQKIIDKIRACLALGDSDRNSSPEEVETALRMAKHLMQKHNLTMDDVAEGASNANEITMEGLAERSGAPKWEYSMCFVCNNLFDTRSFVRVGDKKFKKKLIFVGYPTDVAISVAVYKLLVLELRKMGNDWSAKNSDQEKTQKMNLTRKHKYLYGVVVTLIRRTETGKDPKDDERTESAGARGDGDSPLTVEEMSRAVAISSRKVEEIDDWMEENLELKSGSSKKIHSKNMDAYLEGLQDGSKVNLDFRSTVGTKRHPAKMLD